VSSIQSRSGHAAPGGSCLEALIQLDCLDNAATGHSYGDRDATCPQAPTGGSRWCRLRCGGIPTDPTLMARWRIQSRDAPLRRNAAPLPARSVTRHRRTDAPTDASSVTDVRSITGSASCTTTSYPTTLWRRLALNQLCCTAPGYGLANIGEGYIQAVIADLPSIPAGNWRPEATADRWRTAPSTATVNGQQFLPTDGQLMCPDGLRGRLWAVFHHR
jgi:hypothetical protein